MKNTADTRTVLLISDEERPDDPGLIDAGQFGLPDELYDIPNLQEIITGCGRMRVVTRHHSRIEEVEQICPDYVVLSGRFSSHPLGSNTMQREYQAIIEWIRDSHVPVLGICLGLQLICAAFGVSTVRLEGPGEFGFTPLKKEQDHLLLKSLPSTFRAMELHRCGASGIPEDFDLLVSSPLCPVQMIVHRERPIVAVQFHPELNTPSQQAGLLLLQSFFRLY